MTETHPVVSVVVPTHNRPALLREALASIAAQTLGGVEAVVVNDAGADVADVVAGFPFARLIEHERNLGLAGARNTGLRAARGRYVAYLDDDDVFLPHHLETLVGALERSGAAVAYGDAVMVKITDGSEIERTVRESPDFHRDRFLFENLFPVICAVHRRDATDESGLFDEELRTPLEDWEFWLRLSRVHDFVRVPGATVEVRERTSGRISTGNWNAFRRNARLIFARYAHLVADRPDLQRLQHGYLVGLDLLEQRERNAALRVSIVIPTFNNLELTRQCLDAIERTTGGVGHEVIVVDNASSDDTPAFLRAAEQAGRVRVVLNDENLGFSRACNQGAELARAEFVLFLNNDTIPHAGWLEGMLASADSDPTIGITGAKLLYDNGTIQHAGVVCGSRDGDPFPYHVYLCQPADAPHVNREREFQMVTGACLMIRRELLERIGGFDEGYTNGHEDLDLCLRAREAGSRVVYSPDSVVTHLESRTKRLIGLENFHYNKGVDNEEARGRRRFLERWGATLEIDDQRILAEDAAAPDRGLHVVFTMYGWEDEGGGTILPRQMAKALVRRGHRVTVISTPPRQAPGRPAYWVEAREDDGVHVFEIFNRPAIFNDPEHPEREVDDPAMRQLVTHLLGELRPDIVHYHSFLGFSMKLADDVSRAGVASVYTSHNYWPICPRMYLFRPDLSPCGAIEGHCDCVPATAGYERRLEQGRQMLGKHVDRHLAVSNRVRELFVANGHDERRVEVLQQQPETVDWIWRRVGSQREPAGPLDRPLRIGFIGSLYPHKGLHVLVEALQALEPGEAEAHLFGGGSDGYIDGLRGLDAKGLVTFHGSYETGELPQLLASVDLVCVPSVWEDCAPLVVAEALAARAPVVAGRIGGIPDFVRDGVDGLLVEPKSAAALAAAFRRFVDEPELLGRMQDAIGQPKGFDGYLDELVAHYRGVIAERAERPRPSDLEGARSFAALALADELVAAPELLREYGRRFSGDDDATLVIYAAGWSEADIAAKLGPVLETAGLDGDDSPDLLAIQGDGTAAHEGRLADGVHVLFSSREPALPFARLKRLDEAAGLREVAERVWAIAA
jgi:GT2 family glycosyltransferase/glycosyltransferase involved in cell wall biosynthesis